MKNNTSVEFPAKIRSSRPGVFLMSPEDLLTKDDPDGCIVQMLYLNDAYPSFNYSTL